MAAYALDPATNQLVEVPDPTRPAGMPAPAAPQEKSGMLRRTLGDAGVALLNGAIAVPEAAVGLANVTTGGYAGKYAEALGIRFKDAHEFVDDLYSTQHKAAKQEVSDAKGFLPTLSAVARNPGLVVDTATEAVPSILAGGVLGKAVVGGAAAFEGLAAKQALSLGSKAAAIGEGAITTGQTAESIRQQTPDGTLSPGQSLAAVAAGVTTGAIAYGAGKYANKLGITDMDVLAASGLTGRATGQGVSEGIRAAEPGLVRRVVGGVVSEGALEEMPQSMQEQMWSNVALGKPVTEGVAEAGAQGLVVGGAMGGTVAGRIHNNRVADAVAGMQTLATAPQQNSDGTYNIADHTEALRAVTAWVEHTYPERRAEAGAWRLAQLDALAKGEAVNYDGMPEFAPESAMSQLAAATIAHLRSKEAGRRAQEAVYDDFNTLQQPAAPRVPGQQLTKQEKLLRTQLEAAIANNDYETMTRLQGRLGIRQTPPAAPATPAAPAVPPAVESQHTPVVVTPGSPPIDDITLRAELTHVGAEVGMDKYGKKSVADVLSKIQKAAPEAATVDEQVAAAKGVRAKLGAKATQQAKILDAFIARMEAQLGAALPAITPPSVQNSAKATGVKGGSVKAAMKKVAGVAGANATVEQQAQAARTTAAALAEAGESEAQVKFLNHFADSVLGPAVPTQGVQNVQDAHVGEGAVGGAADAQDNAAGTVVPEGDDATEPPEAAPKKGTSEEVTPKPKKQRNKKPSKSELAAQAAALKAEEAAAKKARHDEALAELKALQARRDAAATALEEQNRKLAEERRQREQREAAEAAAAAAAKVKAMAEEGQKPPDAKELKAMSEAVAGSPNISAQEGLVGQLSATVTPQAPSSGRAPRFDNDADTDAKAAADALAALTPAQRMRAQQTWDEARDKDAELGGVDARGWHTPLWADLSTEAQAHWAATAEAERTEKVFDRASRIDHAIRADEKSKEVSSEAKRVTVNAQKEAVRAANALDILRRAMQLRDEDSSVVDHSARSLQLRKDYLIHMKGTPAAEVDAAAEKVTIAQVINSMIDETGAIAPAKLGGKVNKSIREALLTDPSITNILNTVAEASSGATIGGSGPIGRIAEAISRMANVADITIKYSPTTPDNPNVALRDTGKKDANGNPILVQRLGVARLRPVGVEIEIFSGGENAHTIVHEVVHARTARAIKQAALDLRDGKTNAATLAMTNLDTIAREVKMALGDDALARFPVAFQHLGGPAEVASGRNFRGVAEFVAEVMSNSALQKEMQSMVSMARPTNAEGAAGTMFDRFVSAVRRILKLGADQFSALYKAIDASVMLMVEQEAMGKSSGRVELELPAMATPQAALDSTKAAVGKAISAANSLINKLMGKQELSMKAEELALYLSSTLHIARTVAADKVLRPMKASLDKWFDADRAKTNVIQMVTGFMYPHVRATEVALLRTGKYVKYNTMMNNVAAEMSNLSRLLDGPIDFNKSFADNKLTNPKLDAQYKERFDAARAEYLALKQQQPALMKLVEAGFMAQRKAFVMYTAANLVSTLQQHRLSSQNTSAAAEAILNQYGKLLDVGATQLVDAKHVNSNSARFTDARTSELDAAIRGALSMADHFGGDAMHDQLISLGNKYNEAVANPYHHIARPGRYFVSFTMSDTSRASIDEMNKVLEPYGVVIGGFKGSSKRVMLKLDKLDEVTALTDALRAHKLVAADEGTTDKDVSSGLSDGADRNTNAFHASQAVNKLRAVIQERINSKRASRGATTAADKRALAEMEGMVNDALVDMLEVDSARTALAMVKGVPGYAADYVRSFSKRAEYHVSLISNAYARPMFAEAFKDMKTQIGALHKAGNPTAATKGQLVHDELAKRHSNAMNPVDAPVIDALRAFGHNFYLALSPAYIAVNLMQPYQLTLPVLGARHGFVKSFQTMKGAAGVGFKILQASIKQGVHAGADSKVGKFVGALDAELVLDGVGLSEQEQEFVRAMIRSGAVDLTQAHEIGRLAEGGDRRLAIAAKTMGVAGHYSEVLNRLTAGIAAYRLAKANPKMSNMPEDGVYKYAIEVVDQTQLRYSDHNTARAIGRHGVLGKVTPLAAAFQNYAFQVTEHYVRLVKDGFTDRLENPAEKKIARDTLFATLGATSVLAGLMGLPFATVLAAVANGVGGDDNEDSRSQFRRWLASVFGEELAEIIAKGAPRAFGVDMSSRAGQADMLPGSRFIADRRALKDKLKDGSLSMMGPAVNGGFDIVAGAMAIADGDVAKGFEAMMPLAIRGYAKAAGLASRGAFENKSGNALAMPVTPWDVAVQATGFNPSKKAEQSEANFYYQAEQNLNKQDKAKLVNKAIRAYESGDMAAFQEAQTAIYQYSILHPNDPIADISEKLKSRAKGRALSEYSGTGIIDANAKHLPSISKYGWAQTGINP